MNPQKYRRSAALALVLAAGSNAPAFGQCTPEWLPGPLGTFGSYGTDQPVDSCTVWTPPGSFPRLVIGGRFVSLDGGTRSHIAMWDGSAWNLLSAQGINGDVMTLFDFGGTLVAAGSFNSAGGASVSNIARWNGSAWSSMGTLNDYGAALAMHSGFLFVGGNFTTASGVSANHLARWNVASSAWEAVNSGTNGTVLALGNFPVSGSSVESLIIGGSFTTANGGAANHIVGYNLGLATPWYTIGSPTNGTNGTVRAIQEGLGNLYVGGSFTTAGGISTGGFARWTGNFWQANGGNFSGTVYSLANYYDPVAATAKVAIGGLFPGINNSPGIAFYDGTNYSTPAPGGVGASGSVFCMTQYNSSLVLGGGFNTAGGLSTPNLARWSGAAVNGWDRIDAGVGGPVRALMGNDTGLTAGGDFLVWQASEGPALHVAGTDGTNYYALTSLAGGGPPAGTSGPIYAMGNYTHGSGPLQRTDFIVGGLFSQVAGINASDIAQFVTGSGWTPMGTGATGRVDAILQYGSFVYAAGEFSSIGGVTTAGIGRWNGSWSAPLQGLSIGFNPGIGYALAIYNNQLIVGGNFTGAGPTAASSIARWDGTNWFPLAGTSLNGSVRALTVYNNQLIAAGDFTGSGVTLDRVGAWNGAAWTAMNAGLPAAAAFTPRALTVHEGDLYLGGSSTFDDVNAPRSIYKWNGASWVAVSGSPTHPVYALASALHSLWAGGDFGVGSGHATPYLARFDCSCYANCDNSTTSPILNVADFTCFLQRYAANDPYANCDDSTTAPTINVADFTCYLQKYAAGCT